MNTLTDTPVAGLNPDLSVHPAAAAAVSEIETIAAPDLRQWNSRRVKDLLLTIYAYGLLGFGVSFPLALAAWAVLFGPDTR